MISTVALLFALPTVVIVTPRESAPYWTHRALASCRAALGEGRCMAEPDASESAYRAAIVLFDDSLVVTLRDPDGREVERRELEFSPADTEDQRWVAAGLMVAALTAAQGASSETTASTDAEPLPLPVDEQRAAPEPAPTAAERVHLPHFDAGAVVGQGLDGRAVRVGGAVRGWVAFRSAPVGVTLSLRAAHAPSDPSATWLGGSFGTAVRLTPLDAPWRVDFLGELVAERLRAHAARAEREDAVLSSWRGGGRLGALASIPVADWFSPWVGIDVTLLRPELRIEVEGRPVAHEGPVRWAFSAGGRFHMSDLAR